VANFDFSIEGMEQWLRKVEKHGVAVQRRAAQILGRRIIIATPKKTGFLLANARMGLNITPTGDRWVRPPGYEARGIKARKLNQVSRLAARMQKGDIFVIEYQAEYAQIVHDRKQYIAGPVAAWGPIVRTAIAEVG